MKKSDVKVGATYSAKVSGNVVPVRIDRENPRGGWDGTNTKTKKSIRIKSAQRLRGPVGPKATQPATQTTAAQDGPGSKKVAGSATDATGPGKRARGERGGKGAKRASGLDAAAAVLAEAKEPLNTKEMVERMLAKGLWSTGGKTPAATIYAAIIREIATKGKDARFRKVERGKFTLAK